MISDRADNTKAIGKIKILSLKKKPIRIDKNRTISAII